MKLNLEPEVNNSQAFVCQKIAMKVDVKKITDIMKGWHCYLYLKVTLSVCLSVPKDFVNS